MLNKLDFLKYLQAYIERINDVLRCFIEKQTCQRLPLIQVMKYGTLLGGKRLRPFLVYITGNMFGIDNNTLDVPAAAIECIHAYSLIHDDLPVMDNGNIRRGLPSCHIKYGEANAILAGDALQTLAFSILSDSPMANVADHNRLKMISELAMASGISGMCGGQALDLEVDEEKLTIEKLKYIYNHKTGALIRAAVRLGALSAGDRSNYALPILDYYAERIGLAFQVQDDILDMIENDEVLEKRQDINKRLKKNTYTALLGVNQAQRKAQDLIHDACQYLNQLTTQSLDTSKLEALANYIIQRDI